MLPLILLAALAASTAPAAAPASTETVHLVELFLKAPIDQLPPESLERLLGLDPESLPKKLRRPYQARSLEIQSLKHMADRKKKGSVLTPEDKCEVPKPAKSQDVKVLMGAGYQEITDEEERWLTQKTRCTEHDMLCEFTLQILDEQRGTGKKKTVERRYFLYCRGASCDPLMILVGVHRAGAKAPQSNFFGVQSSPICSH